MKYPHEELARYAPGLGDVTAFEPAPHVMFGRSERDVPRTPPPEKGDHGFWPLRSDYRSVFLLSGPGIHPARLGPPGGGRPRSRTVWPGRRTWPARGRKRLSKHPVLLHAPPK